MSGRERVRMGGNEIVSRMLFLFQIAIHHVHTLLVQSNDKALKRGERLVD